jgi:hypothetical protein
MATAADVLNYLIPTGGWTIQGSDFASIVYDDGVIAVSKSAFDSAFAEVDNLNARKLAEAQANKAALLDRLGITADEAALLLS